MDKKLQGKFMGCPYHGDDYESCIEYSGQAPCDPPEGWQLVPVAFTKEQDEACEIEWLEVDEWRDLYAAMLAAAPKWGGE